MNFLTGIFKGRLYLVGLVMIISLLTYTVWESIHIQFVKNRSKHIYIYGHLTDVCNANNYSGRVIEYTAHSKKYTDCFTSDSKILNYNVGDSIKLKVYTEDYSVYEPTWDR